jgi:hypothetical protein
MDQSEELSVPSPDESARKGPEKPIEMTSAKNAEPTLRQRQLAVDPSYPSSEVVEKIAEKLLDLLRLE